MSDAGKTFEAIGKGFYYMGRRKARQKGEAVRDKLMKPIDNVKNLIDQAKEEALNNENAYMNADPFTPDADLADYAIDSVRASGVDLSMKTEDGHQLNVMRAKDSADVKKEIESGKKGKKTLKDKMKEWGANAAKSVVYKANNFVIQNTLGYNTYIMNGAPPMMR